MLAEQDLSPWKGLSPIPGSGCCVDSLNAEEKQPQIILPREQLKATIYMEPALGTFPEQLKKNLNFKQIKEWVNLLPL